MRAVVCTDLNEVSVQDIDIPEPRAREVRIRIVAAGLCHTDLSVVRGNFDVPKPVVLGHEGCGYVDKVGPGVWEVAPGDPVVCSIIMPCHACPQCDRGAFSICDQWFEIAFSGIMPDGTTRLRRDDSDINSFFSQSSFAEYAVVPVSAVVKVRQDAPLEKLAGLACGISTGLGAAMVRAPVQPGATVAVLGAGGVGVATMIGARAKKALRVIAIDLVPTKLDHALRTGAATDAIVAGANTVEDVLRLTPGGKGVDIFYDAVGAATTIETGIAATRAGGTIVAIGIMENDLEYTVPLRGLINEKIITGTNGGSIVPRRDIPRFVDLMMAGELPFDAITDRYYGISQVAEALDDLEKHRMKRGAFRFENSPS
ncbi:MAG: alcohol dehydrogenase catalytic domain-containing protein [Alphaproteobacteria bacterium]